MNSVYQVIDELRNTSSRNAKIEILKRESENDLLKRVFDATYNTKKLYGYLSVDFYNVEDSDDMTDEVEVETILATLDNLIKQKYNGSNAGINFMKTIGLTLSSKGKTLLNRILSRDLLCGVTKSSYQKAWNLEVAHMVMICHSLNTKTQKHLKYPAYFQMKYDAARCYHIVDKESKTVKSFTRNNKPVRFSSDTQHDLISIGLFLCDMNGLDEVYLDGEACLVVDGMKAKRKVSNGIFNKLIRDTATEEERNSFTLVLWDSYTPESKTPYSVRFDDLKIAIGNEVLNHAEYAETWEVNSLEEIVALGEKLIEQGFEGGIAKNKHGLWKFGSSRSNDQLKVKAELECELRIVSLKEGENSRAGRLGSFGCESEDGIIKVGISGLTEEQQNEYWDEKMIGKIVTVLFNELINDEKKGTWSLFLPRLVEVRLDKDTANTFEEIKYDICGLKD